jgi:hypothetical protein
MAFGMLMHLMALALLDSSSIRWVFFVHVGTNAGNILDLCGESYERNATT